MTNEQTHFAQAKAALETMRAAVKAQMTPQGNRTDDEYCDDVERIYTRSGYYEALRVYHDAEVALMDWAHDKVRQLPQYKNHRQDMERVFASHLPSIREKTISLCMRLEA